MTGPVRIGDLMAGEPVWRKFLSPVKKLPRPRPRWTDQAGRISGLNPWDALRRYLAGTPLDTIAKDLNTDQESVRRAVRYALRRSRHRVRAQDAPG